MDAGHPNDVFATDTVVGYVAQSLSAPYDIVIAFRGPERTSWLNDVQMQMASFSRISNGGNVWFPFASYYATVRGASNQQRGLADLVSQLVNDEKVATLHICGHGAGAVLATLLAIDVVGNSTFKNVSVYTFSSPRVGDSTFVQRYNELVPDSWRIAASTDLVPKLPPSLASFQHVKTLYQISTNLPPRSRADLMCQQALQTYLHALDSTEPLDPRCGGEGRFSSAILRLQQFYEDKHSQWWFWPVNTIMTFAGAYLVGLMALLLLAWRSGSTVFSRNWLVSIAARPLLVTPALGRWALFLGYESRLRKLNAIEKVANSYFGLPADGPDGRSILPDDKGELLHRLIADSIGSQHPIIVLGTGGAGKSTLLARLMSLAIERELPIPLRGFLPVLVSAGFYTSSLTKAITDTLRERDGVAVTEEMVIAQLQSGRFLILFDGLTEVAAENKHQSSLEILRTAAHFDYRASRFVLATRPIDGLPIDLSVIRLKPLTPEVISELLPRFHLGTASENMVKLQLQSFGSKSLEPLLLEMILAQSAGSKLSRTRADLYEAYFRRLLRAESDRTLWDGWRVAFEYIAQWLLLDTGKRGVGLPHSVLVNRIAGVFGDGRQGENLIATLRRLYHFPAKDELELVQNAEGLGLLVGGRKWRFAHDTFEEYFAASRLLSIFEETSTWPLLDRWVGEQSQQQDFLEVVRFVSEMTTDDTLARISQLPLPAAWRQRLRRIRPESVEKDPLSEGYDRPIAPLWPSYEGNSQFVGTSPSGRVTVYVDPLLDDPGLQNARDLLGDADRVVAANDAIFGTAGGPVSVIVFAVGEATDGTGGAAHSGCDYTTGDAIELCASFAGGLRHGSGLGNGRNAGFR
jgi:hypothetical protein